MTSRAPRDGEKVLAWLSDPEVGIEDELAVAWMIDGHWWSGLPGKFINLSNEGWTVVRWRPLGNGETEKGR